jgi:hypothetical protein
VSFTIGNSGAEIGLSLNKKKAESALKSGVSIGDLSVSGIEVVLFFSELHDVMITRADIKIKKYFFILDD